MNINCKCMLVIMLATAGCVSDQVSMRIDGANAGWQSATTRTQYHISSMSSRNPELDSMLKQAGGVNAKFQSGRTYTPSQIRSVERQFPAAFDEDGVPVNIEIVVSTDMETSLWMVPYCLLCGCSLCILPFYNSWSETSTYCIKTSNSSQTQSFSVVNKYESCFSLLGLNNLVPLSPIDGADCKYQMSDAAGRDQASRVITQAIISKLQFVERTSGARNPRKKSRMIGD